ncbi:unnamed protein product [Effrenium voratum]|nr:unnamed protein product [Effrenium voratum]
MAYKPGRLASLGIPPGASLVAPQPNPGLTAARRPAGPRAIRRSPLAGIFCGVCGALTVSRRRSTHAFGSAELVQLELESDDPEALTELLEGLGAQCTAVRGKGGELLRETATDNTPTWSSATVSGMFAADADIPKILAAVRSCFDLEVLPPWTVTKVQDIDWVEHVQRSWEPLLLGDGFKVLLPWHEGPEGGCRESQRVVLRLEGGAAFGLGDHPTTQGAVAFLEKVMTGGETVLDYGAGSGVLAICAAHLGASEVIGVDVDKGSVDSASRSCLSSLGIEAPVSFLCGPESFDEAEELCARLAQEKGPFDVVVANILRRPLIGLAPALARACATSGQLALTGLRVGEGDAVRQAFSLYFSSFEETQLPGGWLLVTAEKGPAFTPFRGTDPRKETWRKFLETPIGGDWKFGCRMLQASAE